jgi:hypothetical protein
MTKRLSLSLLSAVAAVLIFGVPAHGLIFPADHLECFKIKDPAPKARYTATLIPEFAGYPIDMGCTVKVPASMLCSPVLKANVNPPPANPAAPDGQRPLNLFVCYKLKCPRGELEHVVEDQFGDRTVKVTTPKLLCTPTWFAGP